ncbi:hypothetical protein PISL3812_08690 [Talaromyces islandicus]|uniref:Uncharacterized protein n=1 Tax=Talaromyces islandicus TaxID=28573 RepID=A0A0U1M9K0_TALIS|nr:hypothetical protein PISL3812_08690 [Talaromyces islandicus]
MSLQAVYERFLASPSAGPLARDVSLNYITTTTVITGADAVLSHLQRQQKIVEKKGDKTLSAIETADALVLDVETTLGFVSGGGAYLPSLDDNFLADRVVTFPTVHIVRFDSQAQIQQIRVYWDQGSLLKQVEVIGSRGRNWPIRDAKDQSKLITNTIAAQGSLAPVAQTSAQQQNQQEPEQAAAARPASPTKRHIKDPHASLSLFGGDDDDESRPAVVAPYAPSSTRPPVRDPNDILTGGYDENDPTNHRASVISPRAGANKHFGPIRVFGDESDEPVPGAVQPRIGSSRNFQPIRVFDTEDEPTQDEQQAPRGHVQPKAGSHKNFQPINLFGEGDAPKEEQEPRYKTHPKKFSHFDMAGEETEIPERPARKFRPMSQWDFADFATPEKPRGKVLPQDVRHFGWSDNEEEIAETPPARPRVVQPRRDAETHFSLTDQDGADSKDNKRIIGSAHNKGLSLYQNNVYDDEGNPTPLETAEPKQPHTIVPNNTFRKKDFDSHWAITDSMPPEEHVQKTESKPISSDRAKAVKMMDASWDNYDESPEPKKQAPMPSIKRSTFQPSWGFGDDDE